MLRKARAARVITQALPTASCLLYASLTVFRGQIMTYIILAYK